ncbi:MAG: hypothetical protein H6Q25_620 [Bacteroidetes bacterium]|nr:hypothetical protein [Bacteroidota bacterium]
MKYFLLLLSIILIGFSVSGQSKIKFGNDILNLPERNLHWTINGITYTPSDDEIIIYPHKKSIDTIFFQETINNKTYFDTIYSRIPNKTQLIMNLGCCDVGFDLITKDYVEEMTILYSTNTNDAYDTIYPALLQFGKIKFEIINKPISDTVICFYGGSFNIGLLVTEEKDYGWLEPCRYGYPDNIINISIIKKSKDLTYNFLNEIDDIACFNGENIIELNYENDPLNIIYLKKFGLRLFNNEKVIIQFDYLTNQLTLFFNR